MVGGQALYNVRAGIPHGVYLGKGICPCFLQHGDKFHEDLCRGFRILHRPVMIFQGDPQGLRHSVQGMLGLVGEQDPGDPHCVHIGKLPGHILPPGILLDKAHIKTGIVGNQHSPAAKSQKFRQYLLNERGIHYHAVINACELFDLKRDGDIRVDKRRKPVCDLSLLHLHRPDLNDPVIYR
ncbi:hypothetical protein IMSAGC019_00997 [Lachnospiraceae bacterium]|nr:hypothetical protein IMSAGC019_00997 [Lachnospiraceae bacterium]